MKIEKASDWYTISAELRRKVSSIGFNKDLSRLINNVEVMIQELGQLQVRFGRVEKKRHIQIEEKVDQINKAIDYIEKLVTMATLMK